MEISELNAGQWILFLLPVVLLLVALPIWLLWLGRKPRLPEGDMIEIEQNGYTVICVFAEDIVTEIDKVKVAKDCALALWCTAQAWVQHSLELDEDMEGVVVSFLSDKTFNESPYPKIQNAAAFAQYSGAHVGPGWPMAVVRADAETINDIILRGEPIIHECLHLYLGEVSEPDMDRDHDEEGIWGSDNVQSTARAAFATYKAAEK